MNEIKTTSKIVSSFFKINDFLSLRFLLGKTHICVRDEIFSQCKYLLIEIPNKQISNYKHVNSIDEASELYSKRHEKDPSLLEPKTEFWGHCSNLQAWYENDYDTRILHSNLAFPLLKKLTEAGDPLAEKVFKEEIISRLESEYFPIFQYLTSNGYLDFFKKEELKIISKNLSEPILKIFVKYYRYFRGNRVILLNKNTAEDRKKIIFSNYFKLEVKEENNKLVDHGEVSIIFLNYQSLFNHFKTHSDYRYIWFSYKTIVLISIERNLIELACKILGKKSKYVISTKKFNRPHPFFNSRKSMCSLTSRKNEKWFKLYSPEKKIQISIRIPTYLEDHICE